MQQINAAALLTDDFPQRPDAHSEVGVGHSEDFADGGGDTEGNKGFVKAGEGAVCAANSCRYSPS